MALDNEQIEEMMKRLGCKGEFISQKHIHERIKEVDFQKVIGAGHLFMFCFIKMDNDFVIHGKPATCMDPENWRDKIGQKISFDNSFSEIFKLEAYRAMSDKMINIERVARRCHELNKSYCESIGDNSQVSWNEAPDWQKESAIAGVKFRIDNPDATAADMHESWLKAKQADGWVYGEVKDEKKKTHPCMLPYLELPAEQRIKDTLFKTTVDEEIALCQ